MNINLNSKYQPLFRDYKDIRIILLSGGRGSGKSFAGSLWLTNKFYNSKKNALYLRKYATNI
jgi:phage terminase large subunit